MKTKLVSAGIAAAVLAIAPAATPVQAQQAAAPGVSANAQPDMPTKRTRTGKHINRIIDMWEKGQPVYYAQISGGGYEKGKEMAATKADYITYEMEHGPLDFKELHEFMRGLTDAGPTRTGHRTPAVIVTLPIAGTVEAVRANAWMIQQTLAAGVHGILLCNAEQPEAIRAMIEAARYPFAPRAPGLSQGTRGNGSQGYASKVWGVSSQEYMEIADPWPLNPNGELLFGLKIENPRADANVETSVRIPGVAFAEWGPGDHGFYIMGRPGTYQGGVGNDAMVAVRARVLAATKAAGIKFLNACSDRPGPNNVIDQIKDGTMICTGGDSPAADTGRKYTKRTDPW
jgi:4-hydroxy-2-oxoheptanedioate aldolase